MAETSESRLPGWAKPDLLKARDEAKRAPYRTMTPEERAQILAIVCMAATKLAMCQSDPARILGFQMPIPDGSRRLLARLRAGYRWSERHP